MDVMPPCCKARQGTAASEPQGTGLLYIAGEKTGCSGILGHLHEAIEPAAIAVGSFCIQKHLRKKDHKIIGTK